MKTKTKIFAIGAVMLMLSLPAVTAVNIYYDEFDKKEAKILGDIIFIISYYIDGTVKIEAYGLTNGHFYYTAHVSSKDAFFNNSSPLTAVKR